MMEHSFPPSTPSNVILLRPSFSKPLSADGRLSPPFAEAMELFDQLHQQNIVLAPAVPGSDALAAAAQRTGISQIEALMVYLTILNYE